MSWLRRLLGTRAAPRDRHDTATASRAAAAPLERVLVERCGGRIVSVPAIDFTGEFAESPDNRFMLLWQDHMFVNAVPRIGRFVLLEDGRVVLDRPMARPQDGRVANDGTFILHDWGAHDALAGTFHAFSADGREILTRQFSANLLNNGLSSDGRLAVSQTCNAPGSPDSSILCVYDLEQRREIARWQPESGWADSYEFPGGDRVRMIRSQGVPLDYSLGGEFIDRRKWYADEVARGSYYVIRDALKVGEEVTGLQLEALREGIGVAIGSPDERWKAVSLRLLGEIEEQMGDDLAALAAYRAALTIDPKIGIKKRAAALAARLLA